MADRPQGSLHLVQELGYGLADGQVKVVEDGSGLVQGFRPDVTQLVGLPDGLDQLLDAPVDATTVGFGPATLAALLDEAADHGQFVQDGSARRLGGMGGEHWPQLGPGDQVGDLLWSDARVGQGLDGLFELVGEVRRARVQVLDPVDLFGHVGQVEVNGEGTDQQDGVGDVGVVEQFVEFGRYVLVRALVPKVAGQHPDPLYGVEQRLAVLADESVAELVSEAPDVGSQGGVGGFRAAVRRHGGCQGHLGKLAQIALLVPPT